MAKKTYTESTYSLKLKDPRWQKKRLKILERDKFTCQNCNSGSETLHVHHKFYIKNTEPWDYDNNMFITLCENCHKVIESNLKKMKEQMFNSFYDFDDNFSINMYQFRRDCKESSEIISYLNQMKNNSKSILIILRELHSLKTQS